MLKPTYPSIAKFTDFVQLKDYRQPTKDEYVCYLRKLAEHYQRDPATLTQDQVRAYFLFLRQKKRFGGSAMKLARCSLRAFFRECLRIEGWTVFEEVRVAPPQTLPLVLTREQVAAVLGAVQQPRYRTALTLIYHTGLRVSEPLNLRIKDVDLRRARLCIRGAKGGHDRFVSLPSPLLPEMAQQMDAARALWHSDRLNRLPLALPHRLGKKYPEYQFAWPWAWLFPAHHPCRHPRTGVLVRYRMHEANVQRAIKQARRKLGLCVLPHELRHGYATHCLEQGANPRAIQAAMGHKSLETTMAYLHAEALSVRSPLESLHLLAARPATAPSI